MKKIGHCYLRSFDELVLQFHLFINNVIEKNSIPSLRYWWFTVKNNKTSSLKWNTPTCHLYKRILCYLNLWEKSVIVTSEVLMNLFCSLRARRSKCWRTDGRKRPINSFVSGISMPIQHVLKAGYIGVNKSISVKKSVCG